MWLVLEHRLDIRVRTIEFRATCTSIVCDELLSEKQKLAHVLDRPEGCRIAMKTSEVRLKSGDRELQDERSGSMVSSQALAAYIVGSTFVLDAPYLLTKYCNSSTGPTK